MLWNASTPGRSDIGRKLHRDLGLPLRQHPLQVQRRVFPLELVFANVKFSSIGSPELAVPQERSGLARVVVAVVIEEDDLAADLLLQPARRPILATRNRLGKNPHGCWPKQMTGAGLMMPASSGRRSVARADQRLQTPGSAATQAAHPMTLYQR